MFGRRAGRIAGIAILGLGLAGTAIAEEVDFEALLASGQPVPGAEIRVYQNEKLAGPVIFADETGTAHTQLPPGDYIGYVWSHGRWVSQRFTVQSGQATRVRFPMTPAARWTPTGLSTGPGIFTSSSDDLPMTSNYDRRIDVASGVRGPAQDRSKPTSQQNAAFDFEPKTRGAQIGAVFPLVRLCDPDPATAPTNRKVVPYARLGIGQRKLDFDQVAKGGSGGFDLSSDSGLYGNMALGLYWILQEYQRWAMSAEIGWEGGETLDADRSPGASSSTGTVLSEHYTLSEEAQTARVLAHFQSTERTSLGFGARWVRRQIDYDGRAEVDFTAAAGIPFISQFEFGSQHEDDWLDAIVTFSALFGERWIAELEASFDGSNSELRAFLSYGIRRPRS